MAQQCCFGVAGLGGLCILQTVSCEIKFAHAHVRAHSHMCDVRAKSSLNRVCDVRACGPFSAVRCAIAL